MHLARHAYSFVIIMAILAISCTAVLAADAKKAEPLPVAKDPAPLIAEIIKAYGGKDAITAVKGVYVKGNITAEMRDDKGTYLRYLERDRKLRVEIKYTKSSELRILNGKNGWRGENFGPLQKARDFRLLSMIYQYKQLEIPYGLVTNAYKVRWAGEAVVSGKKAEILTLVDKEGPDIDVYVDPKSGLILRTTGYFIVGGKVADLTAEFSDYRKVGKTMMPYTVTNYSEGYRIGVNTIVELKVNPKMADKLFRP